MFLALAGGAGSALADAAAPPAPIIVIGSSDIDPTKYDWLGDTGRKGLTDFVSTLKSGSLYAGVFAASPIGDFWSYRSAAKRTDLYNIADLARQALQSCEYFSHSPCFIISVNGKEARGETGGIPAQPAELVEPPIKYDAGLIPFLSVSSQRILQGYAAAASPKAMVITTNGNGLWRSSDTVFAAVADRRCRLQEELPERRLPPLRDQRPGRVHAGRLELAADSPVSGRRRRPSKKGRP
jgi:hypothetical protein